MKILLTFLFFILAVAACEKKLIVNPKPKSSFSSSLNTHRSRVSAQSEDDFCKYRGEGCNVNIAYYYRDSSMSHRAFA